MNLYRFSSPVTFYPLAGKWWPWFAGLAGAFAVAGLALGLLVAPVDFQQGEVYRILYIHVPSSIIGMFIYLVMAAYGVMALALNTRVSAMMMEALAPTGAMFTAIALWTGSLWGRPTWGTYWVWDARITSTLLLLFLYVGYLALTHAIEDKRRADKAGALLVMVSSVNVPVIYFSVKWWNTLHQGSSISLAGNAIASPAMRWGLLLMVLACWAYAVAISLVRVRAIIREREHEAGWMSETVGSKS